MLAKVKRHYREDSVSAGAKITGKTLKGSYSWLLECEGHKAVLEVICNDLIMPNLSIFISR